MRSTALALAVLSLSAVGCGADETVNGVFPSSGFLGRTLRVEVTGDNTSWGSDNSLDFGPGITVSKVSIASPTTIFADIVISDTAAPGLRDVIVTGDGGGALNDAFQLTSPIVVEFRGSLAQGSVVNFKIHNFDFLHPFDDTCTLDAGFFGCLEYGNVNMQTAPGVNGQLGLVSPYVLEGTLFVDLDAMSGPFAISSGAEAPVISPLGAQLEITPRTATALAGGMTTATVATAFESHFYEVTTDVNQLSRFTAAADAGAPRIYVLPESGSFLDMIDAGATAAALSQTAGKLYVVVADASGESGFSYTLRQNPLALTTLAEADASGANDTSGTAQNAGTNFPMLVTGGKITSDTDEDWYRFTVPAGSTTKSVRVLTAGGDPLTDLAVEIYIDPTDPPIGGADDSYHEDVTSDDPVGAATTIYVKIYTDPQYYDPAHQDYVAAIWLQ